jgi:hypothetical protein
MPRFFTHYWLNRTWERNRRRASDGELLDHTAGNLFQERGNRAGDFVYVVSVIKGSLTSAAKLIVEKICDTDEAAAILDYEPWPAERAYYCRSSYAHEFQSQSASKIDAAVDIHKRQR